MRNLLRTRATRLGSILLVLGSLAGAQEDPLAGLDDYIGHAMTTFHVLGVAVTVVKDGKVVLAKGYGVRKLDEPAKVDEHTAICNRIQHQSFHDDRLGNARGRK